MMWIEIPFLFLKLFRKGKRLIKVKGIERDIHVYGCGAEGNGYLTGKQGVTMRKNKKEEAVQNALTTHYDKYYRLAYSYVRNEADAMDIVQESAYKAILKSGSLKSIEYVDTWIYRIVLNEANTFLRARRFMSDVGEMEIPREDTYENIDLRRAIDRLEPKEKAIIILRFFEDRKLDEIADILDENLSTVKSRLYRVMSKLRLQLESSP